MFKLFHAILISALFLPACKRDVTTTSNTFIKYKVNGTQFQLNGDTINSTSTSEGIYILKLPQDPSYLLIGKSGGDKIISLKIVTDTLEPQSYTTPSFVNSSQVLFECFVKIGSTEYAIRRAEDVVNINISRYSSGTIDGTFSGSFSFVKAVNQTSTYTSASITEGSFKNVKISY